jgi:hypothetical protein
MRNSTITAFLVLVCIIVILSGLIIILLHDHCNWQDVLNVSIMMDSPTITVSSNIETTAKSARRTIQGFVISSRQIRFQRFLVRNRASLPFNQTKNNNDTNDSELSLTWFLAANGRDQGVLDAYAALTGLPPIKADSKDTGYKSPHHAGCFMSHWNILRMAKAGWDSVQSMPKALLMLEDDAVCAPLVIEEINKILPLLPPDWVILYVGGKPFTYYFEPPMTQEFKNRGRLSNFSREEFEELVCQGRFGTTATGPFAPDGGRNLSLDQPYWQTKYLTNTHSYVVNPERIDRILHLLEHPPRGQEPIDIMFADAAKLGFLKNFMTTMEFCFQKSMKEDPQLEQPRIWEGYYNVHGMVLETVDWRWGPMYHEKCPSKP